MVFISIIFNCKYFSYLSAIFLIFLVCNSLYNISVICSTWCCDAFHSPPNPYFSTSCIFHPILHHKLWSLCLHCEVFDILKCLTVERLPIGIKQYWRNAALLAHSHFDFVRSHLEPLLYAQVPYQLVFDLYRHENSISLFSWLCRMPSASEWNARRQPYWHRD